MCNIRIVKYKTKIHSSYIVKLAIALDLFTAKIDTSQVWQLVGAYCERMEISNLITSLRLTLASTH